MGRSQAPHWPPRIFEAGRSARAKDCRSIAGENETCWRSGVSSFCWSSVTPGSRETRKHLGGNLLGRGSYRQVQETDVLGGSFAVKFLEEDSTVEEKDSCSRKKKTRCRDWGITPT